MFFTVLAVAVALKSKGVPVPDIAKKLVIKTGENAGKNPSVASLYRALAESRGGRRPAAAPRRRACRLRTCEAGTYRCVRLQGCRCRFLRERGSEG